MKLLIFTFVLSIFSVHAGDLEDIKKDIMDTAYHFKGQADPDGTKQATLEVKVKKLLKLVPKLTMEEKAIQALGTWRQVWGPYSFDDTSTIPVGIDVNHIYQSLYADGYYYNFSEYLIDGQLVRNYVRGIFSINDNDIDVQFDRVGLLLESVPIDYSRIGKQIEDGSALIREFPADRPPVGIRGKLVEVFSDNDMRINYGVIGDDLSKKVIFVMERVK